MSSKSATGHIEMKAPSLFHRFGGILSNRRLSSFWEKLGIHVIPVHFYQPIPDRKQLADHEWGRRSVPGIELNDIRMLEMLEKCSEKWIPEFARLLDNDGGRAFPIKNGMFEAIDADMLYCQIRRLRPRRIVEVGCGFSSLVMDLALAANRGEEVGYTCDHLMVDPYPSPVLDGLRWPGNRLIKSRVQSLDIAEIHKLGPNDILFIDSSHVLATGSDVEREFRELVPSVGSGVAVHVHDIFTPYDYPKDWVVKRRMFWTEQYALENFLAFNSEFEVLWAGNFMKKEHPGRLKELLPHAGAEDVVPGSFWIQRRAQGAS